MGKLSRVQQQVFVVLGTSIFGSEAWKALLYVFGMRRDVLEFEGQRSEAGRVVSCRSSVDDPAIDYGKRDATASGYHQWLCAQCTSFLHCQISIKRRGVTRCVQAATPQRTPAGKRMLRTAQL
jgi:hypothetical protein